MNSQGMGTRNETIADPDPRVHSSTSRGDCNILDSHTLAAPRLPSQNHISAFCRETLNSRALFAQFPQKTLTFPPARAHTFHRAHRPHSALLSPPLPAAFGGGMEGEDFLPEGGKLPELKLGPWLRLRSWFVSLFASLICFWLFLLVLWLDRCEASPGFHLLFQEAAAGTSPSIYLFFFP